jgi:hypothetical protein
MLTLLSLAFAAARAGESSALLDEAQLEAEGVLIGVIQLEKHDVFNTSDPRENNVLYRFVNRLHIITKDSTIKKQLLLESGDAYSKRLADESERILRGNSYFYDVSIKPINRHDGVVDLLVTTSDVWTLKPGFSISRKGGENKTTFDIEDLNLFGRGQLIRIARTDDVDRVSKFIEFRDTHIGDNWLSTKLRFSENSDGHSNFLSLIRPFYALDTRWSAGLVLSDDDQRSTLYQLGEQAAEFRSERTYYAAFGGWSAGLRDNWVRRFTAGIVSDETEFSTVVDATLPPAIPPDRKLVYPFFGIEILEDHFETVINRDQISKTEDFLTGTRFAATLGWSDREFGADRDAILYSASASRLFGELTTSALSLSGRASGRIESGSSANTLLSINARYYLQQSEKRLFFTAISATRGHKLDLDSPLELGGDTGLRGYPLRYQSGDSKLLLTVEQRYFWDWYPFRLFKVGGALFADVGRTWGDNPLGGRSLGWLRDVGLGLRFASTRTGSRKIVHLDIAFPLDGDASIDNVQILLESKKSF